MEIGMEQQKTDTDVANVVSSNHVINDMIVNADSIVKLPEQRTMEIRNGRLVIQITPYKMTDLCGGLCSNCASPCVACVGGCVPCIWST